MCGINGSLSHIGSSSAVEFHSIADRMNYTLVHRGPDDSGVWADVGQGIALGHRRLSIIDLSPEGHQPMHSHDGRYVIVYNGEIYNYRTLRSELLTKGLAFRGNSDTEVLLAGISTWGLDNTLRRINGMFAFAIWDKREKKLSLVRDRLGKKPLYFGWVAGSFVFGSELKALRAFPGFDNPIDRDALTLYLRHNCIPAPYSIYKGICKLPPASFLTLARDQALNATCLADVASDIRPYWSARQVFVDGIRQPHKKDEAALLDDLDLLLRDAVASRMISDVPLGAFLSGGIDSSLVVALMQTQSNRPVKTFSIGFHEAGHNEAEDAKRVARHLGTEHHELYLTSQDALDVVPKLPFLYDEPFADSSQIPTFLVSKFAREHVTVALSGDGGDELFGGYNRYVWAPDIWGKMARFPLALREAAAGVLGMLPPSVLMAVARGLNIKHRTPADKLQKIAGLLRSKTKGEVYKSLTTHWDNPAGIVIDGTEPVTVIRDIDNIIGHFGFEQAMMYLDMVTYLPDDILVKVDRASMGVSLEARAPLLDYRLAEFAAQIPMDLKIRNRQGKYILRKLLYRYVPQQLVDRPKAGFEMPIAQWLRGPLRDWAEALLDESRLRREGYFLAEPIRKKWQEHLAGNRNWQFHLWDILMFEAWLENWSGSR